jgi:hypothetical protein
MKIRDLFLKPIDRPIEGVIKADDEASLRLEVEEYVITSEIEKRFENFLNGYNNDKAAIGVWISGFFGSGKSHLLKMLALLLENRVIDGVPVLDMFLPKCGDNELLRADIKKAACTPSRSILFNIDQKADIISKTQVDALLAVFVKVFDDMCGYYGKQGHIAQFERDLDKRGLFADFKREYEALAGYPWEKGRQQALLESTNINQAFSRVTGENEGYSEGILEKYRSDYSVSIDDFVNNVKEYIDTQEPGFRLNFFVDEVGQYIAGNVKLMTNLQTISETLATRCRGRSWIIVTAQEEMKDVIGEMTHRQGNDFSKIQDRFAIRMKLTSANVEEVIRKRLLIKNETGFDLLSKIYEAEANNLKTLFNFTDGAQTYKGFKDSEHFIQSYPFIIYQFTLFQSAIKGLSSHNAFEGRHSSVGERSMLGVFQQVVKQISDQDTGKLATFDLMFEGIRTTLKAGIQSSVLKAEIHLDDQYAVKVLKALFLVKYIKEFKATPGNLAVLMLDSFNTDVFSLRKKIEESLDLLEQQNYVQRNGEIYEYLTDEERDVEEEIKNTEIDENAVSDELQKIVFDFIIKDKKIRCGENNQDYDYSRKLDDRLYGRDHELAIHIISPINENIDNETILKMQSMGRDELLVIMPADNRLVQDLYLYKKTDKYIRQNPALALQGPRQQILNQKGFQNKERFDQIRSNIADKLGQSKLFVSGNEIETNLKDAQNRIMMGFNQLVSYVYPNIKMLRGVTYAEENITSYLHSSQESIFNGDITPLSEVEQEIVSFIQANDGNGIRTTLKSIIEHFNSKPYGWYYAAILCLVASIYARGKVEARIDGELVEDSGIEKALKNTHGHSNVILKPQIDFTAAQVRSLKSFYSDFFDLPATTNEPKSLAKETDNALNELSRKLELLIGQSTDYPFLQQLNPVIKNLKNATGRGYSWYLTDFLEQVSELRGLKITVIDPIIRFMSGSQKNIFDDAMNFVREQKANLKYVDTEDLTLINDIINDPECYRGDLMQQLKNRVEDIRGKIDSQVKKEKAAAKEKMLELENHLSSHPDYAKISEEHKQEISDVVKNTVDDINKQVLVAVIRDTLRHFEETTYYNLLSRIDTWASQTEHHSQGNNADASSGEACSEEKTAEPPANYIPKAMVSVGFTKLWLEDEQDVDQYLKALREALIGEIAKGKKIHL